MSEQTEPLRLATVLENKLGGAADEDIERAAAELRRLHEYTYWQDRKIDGLRAVADHHNARIAALEKALHNAYVALDNECETDVWARAEAAQILREALAAARQTLGGKHD